MTGNRRRWALCMWIVTAPVFAQAGAAVAPGAGASAAASSRKTVVLPSFRDDFSVKWNGISVGSMEVSMRPQAGEPNCYVDRATTDPNFIAKAIYGAPRQTSVFCVVDGAIRVRSYHYTVPGDADKSYSLTFDWHNNTVTDSHGKVRRVPDGTVDSLALQQAARLWLIAHAGDADPPEAKFTLIDDKHLTHYRFKLAGRDTIDTPAGRFDAWLMERVDNPGKVGKYWLAPQRDYLPVASETRNGHGAVLTTMLAP